MIKKEYPNQFLLGPYQLWTYDMPYPHDRQFGEIKRRLILILDRSYDLNELEEDPTAPSHYYPYIAFFTSNQYSASIAPNIFIDDNHINYFHLKHPSTLNIKDGLSSCEDNNITVEDIERDGKFIAELSEKAIEYLLQFSYSIRRWGNFELIPLDEFKKHKLQDEKWIRDNVTTGQVSLGESISSKTSVEAIDNLIEDIYNLRKEGMEEEGEYSIKNLIFKEFRNLGYLDNLKELRKKQISKELSLESLKEELVNYSNEDEVNYKTKEIMDVISQQLNDPLYPSGIYTTLGYISYKGMVEGCDYIDLVKLVVPYILFNNTKYNVYYTDKWGWKASDYIITKKGTTLKDLYESFEKDEEDFGDERDWPIPKKEFEDHVFTVDKNANYVNVKID